jgi:serine/threonine protein kinase
MFEALAYLHLNGITHGDVKPGNILLASNGTLKLADFGTATAVLGEDEKTITSASIASRSIKDQLPRLAGTPMYMAPEIIKGGIEARFGAGDVWSAGCVTLRMCTGRQPWDYDFQDEWLEIFTC